MVQEKYLPVGTVVLLKEGTKRVMITGFCTMEEGKTDTIYDYCGCLYPEGFISMDKNLLFNHDQIARVDHMGLVDDEEKAFKEKLNEMVKQLENK